MCVCVRVCVCVCACVCASSLELLAFILHSHYRTEIFYIVAADRGSMDDTSCRVVAGVLQYMLLCVFSWMLMQAIYLYDCFVVVMEKNIERTFTQWAVALYSVPLLIAVISLGSSWSDYSTNQVNTYGNNAPPLRC